MYPRRKHSLSRRSGGKKKSVPRRLRRESRTNSTDAIVERFRARWLKRSFVGNDRTTSRTTRTRRWAMSGRNKRVRLITPWNSHVVFVPDASRVVCGEDHAGRAAKGKSGGRSVRRVTRVPDRRGSPPARSRTNTENNR